MTSAGELPHSAYVVLGMVELGARSGYEIRRSAELSLRFFWAISPAQIYPELKRLEAGGLVAGTDDPQGARARRTFTLTDAGRAALRDWLRDAPIGDVEWRDLAMVKLFLSDVLDPVEVRAVVEGMRVRAERVIAQFDDRILPAARAAERAGRRQPLVVAEFGREFHARIARWCDELLVALDAGRDDGGGGGGGA